MEKLVDIVHFLNTEIHNVFGSAGMQSKFYCYIYHNCIKICCTLIRGNVRDFVQREKDNSLIVTLQKIFIAT